MIISLSRPGNSIDNAMCETFFSSLKEEWKTKLKQNSFINLKKVINNYVEFYNYTRIMIKHNGPPAYVYIGFIPHKKILQIILKYSYKKTFCILEKVYLNIYISVF
ncbi:IS3 family transposase [Spiroplasma gladiatoris]|uniref:IS3 family transposase n=1 Tax=Spiroplasma gladiatoris TaxID=2143 RepID=A0A4P7AJ85_9MOLU|nr:IS3 family transposase [Spiroplasma gladiatoris]QBQ07590.1 IS3 family transposase [Spiroplasma gladiatoris]